MKLLNNKISPKLVDYSFYLKPAKITKPSNISISFYFNIIIILLLILGLLALYYRHINKKSNIDFINNKINKLNDKINSEFKNIT